MAGFTPGAWNYIGWDGKWLERLVNKSAVWAIAEGPGGLVTVMPEGFKEEPIFPEAETTVIGKGQDYVVQDMTPGIFELRARKFTHHTRLLEEDGVVVFGAGGAPTYDINRLRPLRDAAWNAMAVHYDNAALGTTGARTPGDPPVIPVPFESVYRQVSTGAPDNLIRLSDAASVQEAFLEALEIAENGPYGGELSVVSHSRFKTLFRGLTRDGSNGIPLWDEGTQTLGSGHRLRWSPGAKAVATASSRLDVPGNPLLIIGPTNMFRAGRAPFMVGGPSQPQAFLTDPATGIGASNDTAWWKTRARWAFTAPIPASFVVVELDGLPV